MKLFLLLTALVLLLTSQISNAQDVKEPATHDPSAETEDEPLSFWASIADTFAIIFVAEIADKVGLNSKQTFIMVIIFSMSMNKWMVYAGATITMVLMHTIATFLGGVFPLVFNHDVIKWAAVTIFSFFGVYLIVEGCRMKNGGNEEYDLGAVKEELVQQGHIRGENTQKNTSPQSGEALVLDNRPSNQRLIDNGVQEQAVYIPENQAPTRKKRNCCKRCFDNAFFKMAAVCFLAEFGDRSQITAVALAAANNVWGVWLGGAVAHIMCTSLGVGCGAILVGKISPRALTIISGIICLVFALEYIIFE